MTRLIIMTKFSLVILTSLLLATLVACNPAINSPQGNFSTVADGTGSDQVPVAENISSISFSEDSENIFTLDYKDQDGNKATSCSVSALSHVTKTQNCSCDENGTCTVGMTGITNYNGPATFNFQVTANGKSSNLAIASFTITAVEDAPVAINITPAAFNEDTQSIITLSYTDPEFDQATSCSLSALSHVTETTPCSCILGVCSVGITGPANYAGAAGFTFNVTANGLTSDEATASLTISSFDDAPVTADITPGAFNEDTLSFITLSYTDLENDKAATCSIGTVSNVSVSQSCTCNTSGLCTVGVIGTANFNGAAGLTYTVSSNGNTSNLSTANLTINATDDAPVALNISPANFNEDTQELITLSYNDVENDKATSCSITSVSQVTVTQACSCNEAGLCSVGLKGVFGFNGSAGFNYRVTANGASSNTATASFTIIAIDDAPVANDISPASFNEDVESIITLSYNDAENNKADACSISALSNVTVTEACSCNASGICLVGITGLPDFNGTASFDFSVNANGAGSNAATASLVVNAMDDAPVAQDITPAAFNEDTKSIITLSYSDLENDKATACTITGSTNVTINDACSCNGAGVCTVGVTGTENYFGSGLLSYKVTANGYSSNTANATLTINSVNDSPVALNITPPAFNEDTESLITLSYSDTESDEATSCTISSLTNLSETTSCTCSLGICTVGVTGNPDYFGSPSFSYTISAGALTSASASATLSITSIDDAPVAQDITPAAFNEDTTELITLSYTDIENNKASACTVSTLLNVSITQPCECNASGICKVGVKGTADYNGAASFTYIITANSANSNSANASLEIHANDDAPVATNLTPATFNEDTQSIITLSYTDPEGDKADSCTISAPTNVTVTQACECNASGSCTVGVTGTTNFNGIAGLNYTISANGANSNSASASFTISAVDDAPVALNITPAAISEDSQSIITLSYTDLENNKATACTLSSLNNLTETQSCSCNASGVCTVGVTGITDFNGSASFNYAVSANGLSSGSASASLSINATDDAPVAANISPTAFNEDNQATITLSYSDLENDKATACSLSSLTNVSVTQACACNGAGVCTAGITGTLNFNGSASFNYSVTANGVASNTATASLTISAIDDAPVVANITPSAFDEETQSIVTLLYTDTEGDKATSCAISDLSHVSETKSCACDGAGVCTVGVTGAANFNGTASFNYTVTTNSVISNSALSSFSINPIDDAPVANTLTPNSFAKNVPLVIALSYTDPENDQATSCTITSVTNVTETQSCLCSGGICSVEVTGVFNYTGSAAFTYTVTANGLVSSAATANLTITASNTAPVASNISPAAFNEDTQSIITLSYADVDTDKASACTLSGLSNVTVTQACACNASGVCTVGVTGTSNYTGAANFDYTVTANAQTSNSATATLAINAVDDVPVASHISPVAFNEDTQSIITLSYTDIENDKATACTISSLSHVTVTQGCACNGSGVCTVGITGSSNYNGSAGFDFAVTANGNLSNNASGSLSINAVDDAPVAASISPAAFSEDSESIITLSYSDIESDQATSCSILSSTNISVTQACACDGSGICSVGVTGTSNFNGGAAFTYKVTANGLNSNTVSASLTINQADDAPVAINLTPAAFDEDTESIITLIYTDNEFDQAVSCSLTSLSHITETTACSCSLGTCTVGVKGTSNYNGLGSFDYTVTTNALTSSNATASLTISTVDDSPVAANLSPAAFNEDTQELITLSYSDIESDKATACTISSLSHVSVSQACACDAGGACTVGITSEADYNGPASFDYVVTANGLTSISATASLTISATDDAPVAANIAPIAFNEDTQSIITLSYSDLESNKASACTIASTSQVLVSQACACDVSGVCTAGITGTSNYNGSASFTYYVTANSAASNTASASLTINSVDDAPLVSNISSAAFNEDNQSLITLSYSDIENDKGTTCSISNPSNVTITQACACNVSGECIVGVTGTTNFNGTAGLDYAITANGLASGSASATFNISAVDDAPVAANINPSAINEDTQELITLSYSDIENDKATSCSITSPSNLTVTEACDCDGSGICTVGVTGGANYNGSAGFSYTVSSNGLTSNSASASFAINATDDAPVAINLAPAAFNEDTQAAITLSYTDTEFDQATSCTISSLSNVTVTSACTCSLGACSVGVTGASNYNGIASFNYTLTANGLTSSAATASLTISPVDDAPLAANISPAAFSEDTQSIISLSYSDIESDKATGCSILSNTNVTVTQDCSCDGSGICNVGVTGTTDFNGSAAFTYRVTANGANSNSATATLTINATDDAPVAANISPAPFNEDTQEVITLTYSDRESDKATACTIASVSNITVTQACTCNGSGVCSVGVTGTSNYNGAANFNYSVTANSENSNNATASLTLSAVNDTPVASSITPADFNEDVQSIITLSYTDIENDKATACSISSPVNVTVTEACACNGAGVCTVGITGTANFNGSAGFDYAVTANGQTSSSASASLTITGTDDAPEAININPAAFSEDVESIINLSYSDIESDKATACTIISNTNVSVTQTCSCNGPGVCTVGVKGSSNYNGSANFTYTVTANGTNSNTATATLTITAADDAPVVTNITPAAFNEDTQAAITLSYTDTEFDQATSCTISSLSNVTVTSACTCSLGACSVGVTGASNYNGIASFNYTLTANGLTSSAATASLTISPVDDAPLAANISPAAFSEDTQSIISLSYSDIESDKATGCSILSNTNVTVTQDCSCDSSGICTVGVTGTTDFNGSAAFTYRVTANGANSNSATATLTINSTDDAPVALSMGPAAFNEDTQSIITLSYTDTDNNLASACTITSPSNVTVTQACVCSGSGICTVGVTGDSNFNGSGSFSYTVTANAVTSNVALVSLSMTAIDDAPITSAITPAAFNEDIQSIIILSYTDVENDKASACQISSVGNVTVTEACVCNGSGVCTVGVTGTSNYSGSASFTYTVTANSVSSNTSTATLSISSVDDAPVAVDLTPSAFNEDTQSIITLSYSDAESDKASACTISSPTNVTVTQACSCNASGICTVGVTGAANFNGSGSFAYTVTANSVVSNSATASFNISAIDDAPVAANLSPTAFNEDTQSIITLSFSDSESDLATSCTVLSNTNVTVTQACACNGSGVCTVGVTGTSHYNGSANFTYRVTASGANSNTATATLAVNAVDDAPVASNITPAAFNEDTQSIITLSYSDVESDKATACSISSPTNVTVTQACACNASGVCTVGITGSANYNSSASFNYTVTANAVASNSATATLTISAVDDAPIASSITPAAFNEDTESIITLSYADIESDNATACTLSSLSNVTVTQSCACNGSGICTVGVTGTTNYNGSASFAYTVTANSAVSNSVTATLEINAVDDAPVAANFSPAAFNEDTQTILTLSYSDVDSDKATSCTIATVSNVTVTQSCVCNGSGVCTVGVTGTSNYSGSANLTYNVMANSVSSNTATATLTVSAVDDAPVASNISGTMTRNTQSILTLSYTDVENHQGSSCSISALTNVTVTLGCACSAGVCTVGVTGTSNYTGSASFSYTVSANGLSSNSANATLTINAPANTNPTITLSAATLTVPYNTQGRMNFTLADAENTLSCNSTFLSMSSSNTTLVPNANVAWSTSETGCDGAITPALNQSGTSTITFTVNDGSGGTATASFTLTVNDGSVILAWEEKTVSGTTITSYSYGTGTVSSYTTTKTFVLKNKGTTTSGTVTLVAASTTGNVFKIPAGASNNTCSAALAVNGTCEVTVQFSYTNGTSSGLKTGTLTATSIKNSVTYTSVLNLSGSKP